MFSCAEEKNDTSWHVGKNKNKVVESAKIIHKFDYENEVKSGLLLGYPEESAKAYAQNRGRSEKDVMKVMVGTGSLVYKNPYLKDKYYSPYIFYNMPKSKVVEESEVAKKWADVVRKEVPLLAKWFEKSEHNGGK